MKVVAAVLAAGSGTRFGGDKTDAPLGDRPVWRWSFDAYLAHPRVDGVILVTHPDTLEVRGGQALGAFAVLPGGSSRQASCQVALNACPPEAELLLVHDAARPFVPAEVIDRVIDATFEASAAAASLPVTDTIKEVGEGVRTLDRSRLRAMQTPQGVLVPVLRRAFAEVGHEVTDEMALVEAIGIRPALVEGDQNLFKITRPEDLFRARRLLPMDLRTGTGYDIHRFSDDPARPLWLGGVHFPSERALEGHSDADALLHALTDAILGAAGLGDIGQHFPPSDPRWKDVRSATFLSHAAERVREMGYSIQNVDATVLAEAPKIGPRLAEMKAAIAEALDLEIGRVGLKATTNEGLGAIGRREGIAAMATATLSRGL